MASTHRCEICEKEFKFIYSLQRHLRRHRGDKPHVCLTCGAAFVTISDLKQHSDSHSQKKGYICHICGKAYKQSSGLYIHKQTAHTEICKFICSICGTKFMLKQHLRRHVKHVHEEKEPCPICGRSFRGLTEHMKVCGQRDRASIFTCDLCKKMFKSAKTLREHNVYAHVDPKRYSCTACGKRFAHRKTAIIHKQKCPGIIALGTVIGDMSQQQAQNIEQPCINADTMSYVETLCPP